MTRRLNIAAIRMDAAPADVTSRLERAEALVARAAQQGAQIAVLPELFNSGYVYSSENYRRAESADGLTANWLRQTARTRDLYIAGSLLICEPDGIYNSMLLVSPDGRVWRYDKSHPWAWERAYFRPRKKPMEAAETDLGKIGMLICADVSRSYLWAQYAGKVDLMIASSCPPMFYQFVFSLPDGRTINTRDLGSLYKIAYRIVDKVFGELFLNQARWLGVPSVNTTGAGTFKSALPRPIISLSALFSLRPDLWKYISHAAEVVVSMEYFDETFVADANGNVVARTKLNGDDLVTATVELDDKTPQPKAPQPAFGLLPSSYSLDDFVNSLMTPYYNKRWRSG